jgi:putative transposase
VPDNPYRGHRFPKEIISECVWLYFRFGVSFRDVEEMVAARGVVVSYETIRCWCDKFGKAYADGLRRRRARTGDKWHLDEVFLKINGITHYLWRAVDQNGVVLDILVQPRRDRFAAIRFFRRVLRATGRRHPRVIICDDVIQIFPSSSSPASSELPSLPDGTTVEVPPVPILKFATHPRYERRAA